MMLLFFIILYWCGEVTTETTPHAYQIYYKPEKKRDWAQFYEGIKPNQLKTPEQHWFLQHAQAIQITNMTGELLKDCQIKMRQLDALQEEYRKDENYELGVIAATVMEKFAHMTQIYRYVSRPEYYDHDDIEKTTDILRQFQTVLSDYNEIRIERNLFYDILKKASQKEAEKKRVEALDSAAGIDPKADKDKQLKEAQALFSPADIAEMKEAFKREQAMRGRRYGPLKNEEFGLAHEEYKRSVRQMKWMQKWQGFNPDVEGIPISKHLAEAGLHNESDFLGLNPF